MPEIPEVVEGGSVGAVMDGKFVGANLSRSLRRRGVKWHRVLYVVNQIGRLAQCLAYRKGIAHRTEVMSRRL